MIIDICKDSECPLKETCYRFEKGINSTMIQRLEFEFNNGCKHYWDVDHKPKQQL